MLNVYPLCQQNQLWSHVQLGNGSTTIGQMGCAITTLAMLLNSIPPQPPHPYVPSIINMVLRTCGCYRGRGQNEVNWPMLNLVFPQLTYAGRVDCPDRPTTQDELRKIQSHLTAEMPIIIYVDARQVEPGLQQHFVLVARDDPQVGLIIADPWDGKLIPLCPRYGPTAYIAICGIIWYDQSKT